MRKGFTLIEIIIASAAALLIFIALINIVLLTQRALASFADQAEILQNGRVALERIARELRQADVLVSPLPASALEFQDGHESAALNYIRYYTQNGGLHRELSYYAFAADPEVHVRFNDRDIDGNLPQKTILTDDLVAEYLQTLTFEDSSAITITLTLTKGASTAALTTTIYDRNLRPL